MVNYEKRANQTKPAQVTPSPAAPSGVNLSKITLTKQSPSVSLTKAGSVGGFLRVNLNWQSSAAPARSGWRGLLSGGSGQLDLDLGCLWELADGTKGVVQALGNSFGSLESPPYVHLDGDDRSGANTGGENLLINLSHANRIRRILVFAYIYEGAPSWDQARGIVTLYPAAGPQVEVHLDESAGGARFCAVALLQNDGRDLTVRREVRYVVGSQETLDRAYGWGMRWTAGSK